MKCPSCNGNIWYPHEIIDIEGPWIHMKWKCAECDRLVLDVEPGPHTDTVTIEDYEKESE